MENTATPLPSLCLALLEDKVHGKRKGGGLIVEEVTRGLLMLEDYDAPLTEIITFIETNLLSSINPDARKGGLLAMASMAVGASGTKAASAVAVKVTPIVLALSHDRDPRVRFYSVEALFNILKVARSESLNHFAALFKTLCALAADVSSQVRSAAVYLDRLLKEIAVTAIEQRSWERFSGLQLETLSALFASSLIQQTHSPAIVTLTISWAELVAKAHPSLELKFMGAILPTLFLLSRQKQNASRLTVQSALQNVLEDLKSFRSGLQPGDAMCLASIAVAASESINSITNDNHPQIAKDHKTAIKWISGCLTALQSAVSGKSMLEEVEKATQFAVHKLLQAILTAWLTAHPTSELAALCQTAHGKLATLIVSSPSVATLATDCCDVVLTLMKAKNPWLFDSVGDIPVTDAIAATAATAATAAAAPQVSEGKPIVVEQVITNTHEADTVLHKEITSPNGPNTSKYMDLSTICLNVGPAYLTKPLSRTTGGLDLAPLGDAKEVSTTALRRSSSFDKTVSRIGGSRTRQTQKGTFPERVLETCLDWLCFAVCVVPHETLANWISDVLDAAVPALSTEGGTNRAALRLLVVLGTSLGDEDAGRQRIVDHLLRVVIRTNASSADGRIVTEGCRKTLSEILSLLPPAEFFLKFSEAAYRTLPPSIGLKMYGKALQKSAVWIDQFGGPQEIQLNESINAEETALPVNSLLRVMYSLFILLISSVECNFLKSSLREGRQNHLLRQLILNWLPTPAAAIGLCFIAGLDNIALLLIEVCGYVDLPNGQLELLAHLLRVFESPAFATVRLRLVDGDSTRRAEAIHAMTALTALLPFCPATERIAKRLSTAVAAFPHIEGHHDDIIEKNEDDDEIAAEGRAHTQRLSEYLSGAKENLCREARSC